MIRKSDWDAIEDEMAADARRTLGEPPTNEELLAYSRGELAPEAEARVRALLVANPELARAMAVPFPADGGDALGPDEVSKRWSAFRAGLHPGGKVLQFWRASAALAAALALTFGALLWRETLRQPQVLGETYLLVPGGQRGAGGAGPTLVVADTPIVLVVSVLDDRAFEGYRLTIVQDSRPLWRSELTAPREDGTFRVELPRGFLDAGAYRVIVHGVNGAKEVLLHTYPFRVR